MNVLSVVRILTMVKSATAGKTKRRPPRCIGNDLRHKNPISVYQLSGYLSRKGGELMPENALRELRIRKQLPVKDMVEVVQEIYPKFDRYTQSKCEGDYGIELKPDAMQHLMETFAADELEAKARSRHGKHRLTCRIAARLPDDTYAALMQQVHEDGFGTVQDWLAELVRRYLDA